MGLTLLLLMDRDTGSQRGQRAPPRATPPAHPRGTQCARQMENLRQRAEARRPVQRRDIGARRGAQPNRSYVRKDIGRATS